VKRLLLALLLASPAPLAARQAPARPAAQGLVSASDPRAAAAGAEILRAGGSATDAAIATMLALNVVEPQNSGIGGGAFWVGQDAGRAPTPWTIDGRETAPAAADGRWFLGPDGRVLSRGQAVPGGRSVGVPGAVRLMAAAHRRGGRLPWARLFAPAIRLARDGFRVTPRLENGLNRGGGHVDAWARARFFGADGRALKAGTLVKVPEQAAQFERIAKLGPDSFYVGPDAGAVVAAVNGAARNPSRMTAGDLSTYDAKARAPVCGTYRSYRLCGMGPPSSGGVAVLAILKQLERFDIRAMGPRSATAWHLFAESSRLAYADRDLYLGDPDHVRVPVKGLTDARYLAARSALISAERTMASVSAGSPAGAPPRVRAVAQEVPGTTSLSVTDEAGNVAQVTATIEGYFGSGLTANGSFLNNELTDFDLTPEKDGYLAANRVEGGKRPRSSMSPTIVYDRDGRVRLAVGAAGGSTIIAQVAKAIMAVVDWDMTAQQAVSLGLLYAPGPRATAEAGTELEALMPGLRALGETVTVAPLGLKMNAVEWRNGRWQGAADPRSEGASVAQDGSVTEPPRASPRERPPE
jgi:gamma-glutamyltranspeptidase/glutathione hydrolase